MAVTGPRRSLISGSTLFAWCSIAAVAGLGVLVVPPYLTGMTQGLTYSWPPAVPWFALAWMNMRPGLSLGCAFVLGLLLGAARPRHWFLLAVSAMSLPPLIQLINMIHDWQYDASSHNLFPFEFLISAVVTGPVILGAALAALVRRFASHGRVLQQRDGR